MKMRWDWIWLCRMRVMCPLRGWMGTRLWMGCSWGVGGSILGFRLHIRLWLMWGVEVSMRLWLWEGPVITMIKVYQSHSETTWATISTKFSTLQTAQPNIFENGLLQTQTSTKFSNIPEPQNPKPPKPQTNSHPSKFPYQNSPPLETKKGSHPSLEKSTSSMSALQTPLPFSDFVTQCLTQLYFTVSSTQARWKATKIISNDPCDSCSNLTWLRKL